MRMQLSHGTRWIGLAVLLGSLLPGLAQAAQHATAPPKAATLANEPPALTAAERALKNKSDGETFLAANKVREGVVTLQSGLQYKILKTGDGKTPTIDDTVACRFRGTSLDGTEFAGTDASKPPPSIAVRKVIKGWSEALRMMPVGSKWQLFVPPALAYGARGVTGRVAPDATVIFEVELVSITGTVDTAKASRAHDPVRVTAIRVSFKLDPRLTRSLYLGERWVSPPKYMSTAQPGKSVTVEARAHGLDAGGRVKNISPTWEPADPGMVTVTPGSGSAATITVQRPGESSLRVTSLGVSSQLTINAAYQNDILQVSIFQK